MILSLIEATGRMPRLRTGPDFKFGAIWIVECPFCPEPEGQTFCAWHKTDNWLCLKCKLDGNEKEFLLEWGRLQYMKGYFAGDNRSREERKRFQELTKQQNEGK